MNRRITHLPPSTWIAKSMLLSGVLAAGCSITGTWKNVSVTPMDSTFPVSYVSFDSQKRFTASTCSDSTQRTTAGTYTGNSLGFQMKIEEDKHYVLTGRRRLDGKLVLSHDAGRAVLGTFERVRE